MGCIDYPYVQRNPVPGCTWPIAVVADRLGGGYLLANDGSP
jgi:hypothetical protein